MRESNNKELNCPIFWDSCLGKASRVFNTEKPTLLLLHKIPQITATAENFFAAVGVQIHPQAHCCNSIRRRLVSDQRR